MSIWSSVPGPDIYALDASSEAANYRAEGEPMTVVDVATTTFHDRIRLALWDGPNADVLLTRETARALRDRLDVALAEPEVR
ncbi:hypothetical protein ACGFYY_25290 [Streptomyces sp. NPDC048331]|uniref:hypothetical protein n=1 Tax=Streptomyces sp. NPDC048331 TaxID=3365534 RepID=UPI003714138B